MSINNHHLLQKEFENILPRACSCTVHLQSCPSCFCTWHNCISLQLRTTQKLNGKPQRIQNNFKSKWKTPTPKSKAMSTGRGSVDLKGLKWTYPGFKQNCSNTKRSGLIQTSEDLKWPSILTIRSEDFQK